MSGVGDEPAVSAAPRAARPRRPTVGVIAAAAGAALLLHAIVLGGLPLGLGRTAPAPAGMVQVRALSPAPSPVEPAPGPVAPPADAAPVAPATVAPAAEALRSPGPALPAERPAAPALAASQAELALAAASAAEAPPLPEQASPPWPEAARALAPLAAASSGSDVPAVAAASPEPAPASPAASVPAWIAESGAPLPVYATRFPPSQTLTYRLQRGLLGGSAVLTWSQSELGEPGAHYQLQLLARAAGLNVLTQVSQGGFDAAGLAPRRFTDERLRGPARAANLIRERGLISFSGPSIEYGWVPGVQDRLSWMIQLPAIVDAKPQLAAEGQRITLAVIGARGDAAVWVFRFVGSEPVDTPAGRVQALKFIREPRKPHDTQAEVWLDPLRHHLPARARMGNPPDGEVFELVRESP